LKRDIGPREEEIAKMKEQLNNMDSEIVHFQRTNANLSLIVADLSLRQKGMKQEIENQNDVISNNNSYIKSFENDISEAFQLCGDYKKLKKYVLSKLYEKYVQTDTKKFESNVDIQKEFINQRVYLETCVGSLKKKFDDNMKVHKQDNLRIMKENVELIREINSLKREKKNLVDEKKKNPKKNGQQNIFDPLDKEIEANDDEIKRLQEQFEQIHKQQQNNQVGKPATGFKLPSLEKK